MQVRDRVFIRFTDENIRATVSEFCEIASKIRESTRMFENTFFCVRSKARLNIGQTVGWAGPRA